MILVSKKNVLIFVITILVVACVSSVCTRVVVTNDFTARIHDAVKTEKDYYSSLISGLDTFLEVKNKVDKEYVGDVDFEKIDSLLADYYVGLIGDKYSDYYTAEELEVYMNKLNARFVGIGIAYEQIDGKIYVEEVLKNSPAEEAGIVAGENIIAVDDIIVTDETYEQATSAVAGKSGTKVKLKIEDLSGNIREISVERREIETETVYSEMLDGDIGYVAISQFATNTADKFISAVDELLEKGAKGFIFDVRNNSGGELNCVVNILDRLLPEGPVVHIVDGAGNVETRNSSAEKSVDLPMAVLINEKTASAAELFASALRDYNVAKLYGKTTYGKGYMQRIMSLSDGGGLKLSIAKYNPPYGENYEGVGITPHVEVSSNPSVEGDEQLSEAKNYFINK